MAETMFCVTWNDHANELTTVCYSLLENEFCVDCTIVAEGKSLKAHRLILSARSPYFRMLFGEQKEKHPIVILTGTSFHMLQTVIDFVYYGKTEIPANQFEKFWELAVSLQIKGLDNSLRKDRKTDIGSGCDRYAIQDPSIVNQGICEIGSTWTREEDGSSIPSQQPPFRLPYGYTDTSLMDSSVPVEGCSDFLQSGAVAMSQHKYERFPVQNNRAVVINTEINVEHEPLYSEGEISATKTKLLDHQSSSLHKDPEVLTDTDICVKHELYSENKCLVMKNKTIGDVNQEELMFENIKSEMNDDCSAPFNQDLHQHSCARESFDALGNSGLISPMQHVTRSSCELSPELAEGSDSWPPEHPSRESGKTDDVDSEASLSAHNVAGDEIDEMNEVDSEASLSAHNVAGDEIDEMNEGTESPPEHNLNPTSENILPDEEQATQRQTTERRRGRRQSSPSLAPAQRPETSASPATRQQRTRTGERPCTCGVCGKAFFRQCDLIRHTRTHTGERPYQCDVCGKTFGLLGYLRYHKRSHSGERPYQCDVCGRTFISSTLAAIHKRIHTGERPYSCDICGKAFAQSNDLTRHKRIHTGERPYPCDVCGKAFIDSKALSNHKRTHTGERPYPCDVCGKAFSQSKGLVIHKRTHTGERPYPCGMCEKAFIQSNDLTRHLRTHTRERPYKCDVCGKAFSQSQNVAIHKRTHTVERPYQCDVCGKAFTKSGSFDSHKRSHTGSAVGDAPRAESL